MSQTAKTTSKTEQTIDEVTTPIKSVDPTESVRERFTDNAIHNILPARYLIKDDNGEVIEEPEELFERVAENVAQAEIVHDNSEEFNTWAKEFQMLMETQQFMPNSPTLMNAGTDLQQLSACFVLEPDDDMDDIFKTARDAALVFKSGGGVGYTISHLRPEGAIVSSTGGESSGPLSFLEVYDTTCGTVEQGGKRRGAQMAILRVDHPDIGRFAVAKREEGRFDNFNISAAITDDFKEAVKDDEMYTLYDPENDYEDAFGVVEATKHFYSPEFENNPKDWEDVQKDGKEGELVRENLWRDYADELRAYNFEDGETVNFEEKWKDDERLRLEEGEPMELPARFVFDIMIDGAWRNGEPGLFYFDETNRKHSFDVDEHPDYQINATNPCAEQPLCEFEACNLGHINLSLMMEDDAVPYPESDADNIHDYIHENVDMDQLQRVARSGTRFLDNVVTMSEFPLEEIQERVTNMRKIGLGVMGFAQMLFQMGIRYGSDESYEVAEEVMRFIDWASVQESHSLAKERGTFEVWEDSKYADPTEYPEWFENHAYEDPEDWEDGYPMRNHNTTTVAPTGTTSMLGNTTGGIEPLYEVANFKNVGDDVQGGDMLVQFDDYFRETLEANGIDADAIKEQAVEQMRSNEFRGVDGLNIPEEIADIFVTTGDLSSEQHAKIQRVFQQHVDSGISKTVNLPNQATHEDVFDAFMLAMSHDEIGSAIKGLTVYRDGSRDEQVITTRMDNKLDKTDDDIHQTLEQLHESGELSDVAAKEMGLLDEDEEAFCPDCGEEMNDDGEGCTICPNCFYSPCK